jgi:alpha-L-rhamnosidase
MHQPRFLPALAILPCLWLGGCSAPGPGIPVGLRCNDLHDPAAVGAQAPRFTWELADSRRGARQSAYEVRVGDSPEAVAAGSPLVWTSGKMQAAASGECLYQGSALKSDHRYFWSVRTWDADGAPSEWSIPAPFSTGLLLPSDWLDAKWIGDPTSPPILAEGQTPRALPCPMIRREFEILGPVKQATLYVSALGLYEARINGERVGDHLLAPEWTDYGRRVQYQGYDVTRLVRPGANAIGVVLGDGWYAGRLGMAGQFSEHKWPRAVYGRQPRLIAKLEIETADGQRRAFGTDGSWQSTLDGPIRRADLLDGEEQDDRRQIPDWDRPGLSTSGSQARWSAVVVDGTVQAALVPQPNEPIRVLEELTPRAVRELKPGVWVYDLGQNMAGHCRLRLRGHSGTTVTLRHAEAINGDGTIYTANLRGAPQIDRVTLAGAPGGELFEPSFTYHGFRYVEVSGDIAPPALTDLRGVVVGSSSPVVGTFECSSPLLNRLWKNILWTQHANMMGVPTDCPQRDERLGWTGDILSFGQTAMFNKDMAAFIAKWMQDVRDAQADDGRFADFAPHPYGRNRQFTGVPGWGDVGVFLPWEAYINYGDPRLLEDQFDAAKRWVDWIHANNPDLIWAHARHNDYNDWLNGDTLIHEGWPQKGGSVPNEIFATAFYARSTHIVAEMARVLGRPQDQRAYEDLSGKIRRTFCDAFIDSEGKMPGDTQAGYALALSFDLVPERLRPRLVERLAAGIRRYDNHLSTGFHSSHRALLELSRAGHADLAYQLVLDQRFPSWGYSIANGSTTLWERWDGYVEGRGFQDPGMNSLNHWALGSVAEWMVRVILGINPDPSNPGYSHFILSPVPGGALTHAGGSYRSVRGLIESAWRTEPGRGVYTFTIPAGTSATIHLRAPGADAVREGGRAIAGDPGVQLVSVHEGEVVLEVGAGRYEFEVLERGNAGIR